MKTRIVLPAIYIIVIILLTLFVRQGLIWAALLGEPWVALISNLDLKRIFSNTVALIILLGPSFLINGFILYKLGKKIDTYYETKNQKT